MGTAGYMWHAHMKPIDKFECVVDGQKRGMTKKIRNTLKAAANISKSQLAQTFLERVGHLPEDSFLASKMYV
jgi:hypothetical protein